MARITERWYQDPSFIEDDIVVKIDNGPTGEIVFRDSAGKVIESLVFPELFATDTVNDRTKVISNISFEYSGYRSIKTSGFYLIEVPGPEYEGLQEPAIDVQTVLGWADRYYNPANKDDFERPGLHLSQTVEGVTTVRTFRSSEERGGNIGMPMPILGGEEMILPADRTVFSLQLVAPIATEGGIPEALRVQFGLAIDFTEIRARQ